MTLKETLETVRDELLELMQSDPRINARGPVIPYDINGGKCKLFADEVKRRVPEVDVVCMNQFPRYESYQHYVVVDQNGVFYDAEHVDGCDMEELARAYDAPRPR